MLDISNQYKRLKLDEVKILNAKMFDDSLSYEEKRKIREEIFTGTLYLIDNFIEKLDFSIVKSAVFDIDDITNICCEEWLKFIDSGEMVNLDYFSKFFSIKLYYKIVKNLSGCIPCEVFRYKNFKIVLRQCLKIVEEGGEITFDDIKSYFGVIVLNEQDIEKINEILKNITKKGYISDHKLLLLKPIFEEFFTNNRNIDLKNQPIEAYNQILNQMEPNDIRTRFKNDCENLLTAREEYVLKARCGFDLPYKSYRELASDFHVSRQRIKQIENKALRKERQINSQMYQYYK